MQYSMTQETVEDAASIEILMEKAFGLGRQVRTVFRFRDGRVPLDAFGFVARLDGRMVASIRFGLSAGATVLLLGLWPWSRGSVVSALVAPWCARAWTRRGEPVSPCWSSATRVITRPLASRSIRSTASTWAVRRLPTLMGIEFEEKALGGESGRSSRCRNPNPSDRGPAIRRPTAIR